MAAKVTEESENEGHHCVMNLLRILAEPVYGSAWLLIFVFGQKLPSPPKSILRNTRVLSGTHINR